MDRAGGIDQPEMVDPEKQALVTHIDKRNQATFKTWVEQPQHKQNLALSQEAAQYLIPPKLLTTVSDPSKVKLILLNNDRDFLQFVIAEEMDHPVSDLDALNQLHEYAYTQDEDEKLPFPSNVDPLHFALTEHIREGALKLTEKPYYWITLAKYGDDEVYVEHLNDSLQNRGQGITTSFYNRLREALRDGNFQYLTGQNSLPNPYAKDVDEKRGNLGYFINKLNRSILAELPQPLQEKFHHNHRGDLSPKSFTVDFLHPEKKLA